MTRSNGQSFSVNNASYINDMADRAADFNRTSAKYLYVDSMSIIGCIAGYLWDQGIDFDVDIIGGAGPKSTKHIIKFTLTDYGNRNDGQLQILVWNSYAGECSLQMVVGFFRFCCANGIVLGTGDEVHRVRHWNDKGGDTKADLCMNIRGALVESIRDVQFSEKRIQELESVPVDWKQTSEIIMDLGLPASVTVEALQRRHPSNIENIRVEDQDGNLWCVLNTVNEAYHEVARSGIGEVAVNMDLTGQFVEIAKELKAA